MIKYNIKTARYVLALMLCSYIGVQHVGAAHSYDVDKEQGVAQVGKLSGVVKDKTGEPLIGVTIQVKGNTTTGVVSDIDGLFAINGKPSDVLVLSYMGFATKEVKIASMDKLMIVLEEDTKLLDEIIVIGYGTATRKSMVGAVDQVVAKQISERPVANITQALQGASPSLVIQSKGFDPNRNGTNMNIRGLTTMNDNSPLIVIDGLVSDDSSLNRLNPSDVENISILKDAGTAAIYGSRAAAGVILVTTKQGRKDQKAKVNFSMQYGLQDPKLLYEPVKGYQNALLKNMALTNTGSSPSFSPSQIRDLRDHEDNEWLMKQIIQNAQQQTYNLSVSGGGANSTYMVSTGYFKQGSNYIGPNYGIERYNVRANLTTEYNRFKLTSIMAYTRNNSIKSNGAPIGDAMRQPTYYYYKQKADNGKYLLNDVLSESNPLATLLDGGREKSDNDYVNLNFALDFKIIEGLKARGIIGADLFFDHTFRDKKQPPLYADANSNVPTKIATRGSEDYNKKASMMNMQFLLDYQKKIGKHNITALLGATNESYTSRSNELKMQYTDLDLGTPTTGTIISKDSNISTQNTNKTSITSFLGRANYSYDDKYYGEFSFREDGSSKFAKNNRWGFFPSLSAGWRFSEEDFLSSIKDNVGDFKLRATYGVLGNQRISDYQYMTVYSVYNNSYGFNGEGVSGAGFVYGNKDLKWEKTTTLNLGLDASFLDGSLSFTGDIFQKTTNDILLNPVIPSVFGTDLPNFNSGKLRSQGWDITINYRLATGAFKHNFMVNIGDTWNKVLKFEGDEQIKRTEELWSLTRVGLPIGSYFGYRSEGLFQSYEEITSSAVPIGLAVQPGDVKYVDRNKDGVIDEKDRFVLGNAFPRYTFGLNYNLEFKSFDFGMLWQGVGKRDMDIRGELYEPFHANYSQVVYRHQLDYWTPTNTGAKYARMASIGSASNENNYKLGSDRNILDGKYLRLKNIQIGYTLPNQWTHKAGLGRARVYVTGQNLLTFSKNSFVDPESTEFNSNMNNNGSAYSGRAYPSLKYYGFGLDIEF